MLTYKTVRSAFHPAYQLPNIRAVENRETTAVATRRLPASGLTFAVSMGLPSMEPDVWRKDVHRAKDKIGPGQLLIVSVIGTVPEGGDLEDLVEDYARCARWAAEAGADAIEVQLAAANPLDGHGHML